MLTIERLHHGEAASLLHLVRSVGWTLSADQIRMLLSTGTFLGHRSADELVSSAGVFAYDAGLAFIGTVIVRPSHQRRGLGRALMERCLREIRQDGSPVVVVATTDGLPLYQSLGFRTVEHIHRFEQTWNGELGDGEFEEGSHPFAEGVEAFREDDGAGLIDLDTVAVGSNRRRLLEILLHRMDRGFVVRDPKSCIRGFGLAMPSGEGVSVGPLVAPDPETALRIIRRVMADGHKKIRLDVPGRQKAFMAILQKMGFREALVSPLMLLQDTTLPGNRGRLFALADPALG